MRLCVPKKTSVRGWWYGLNGQEYVQCSSDLIGPVYQMGARITFESWAIRPEMEVEIQGKTK